MLVLSRYLDQKIIIGDDVILTLMSIRKDRVRLGIQAPADLPVHRHEVYERIRTEAMQRATEGISIIDEAKLRRLGTIKKQLNYHRTAMERLTAESARLIISAAPTSPEMDRTTAQIMEACDE